MTNELIKCFGNEKRFVNWKLLEMKGKKTKIPFYSKTNKASSTDEKTWKTYQDAMIDLDNGSNGFSGIGFVFTSDEKVLGVDIDHCVENGSIVHEEKSLIEKFVLQATTYCEVSPSGTGLHLFFKVTEAFKPIANKKAPYELYSSGRYFTVTENPFGKQIPVRTVTPKELVSLLEIIGYPWNKKEKILSPTTSSVHERDDQAVIDRMFQAKNGDNIKKLFSGDVSEYKNDVSSADMALCSHLAFWTGKNPSQMERIWLSSPLGSRKKTTDRKDYRDRTISAAIINCKEVYETKSEKIERENTELDLLFTFNQYKEKVFIQNTENMCRILRKHESFSGSFRYDIFTNTYERKIILENNVNKWRCLEDNDAVDIQTKIQIHFPCFSKVGKDMVYDAIIKVSKENSIDSAGDFMRQLKWDGKERLNDWLSLTYGVPSDKYHQSVGSNWIKGLVKRIIEPGCKFDYVLVLEGEQGSKKSTSLSVLGGAWHVETTMSTDSKDFFMQFSGKAIVEFSEGETLSRTEVKRMKAIITTQVDKYRPPYERTSQDFPRRCVFAMTTNQTEYLKDETGNRRWLPVKVIFPEANISWLKENREQIFAEAYERLKNGETVYEFPKEETARAQNERRVKDPNSDLIVNWYLGKISEDQREKGVTIHQAYRDAINGGFVSKPLDRYNEMSISDTFRNVLGLEKKRTMFNGVRIFMWVRSQNANSKIELEDSAEKAFEALDLF